MGILHSRNCESTLSKAFQLYTAPRDQSKKMSVTRKRLMGTLEKMENRLQRKDAEIGILREELTKLRNIEMPNLPVEEIQKLKSENRELVKQLRASQDKNTSMQRKITQVESLIQGIHVIE